VVRATYVTAGTVPLAANACLQQLAMLAFVLLDGTDGRHNIIQRLTISITIYLDIKRNRNI
jgi:hypothetical protein